MAAGVVAAVIGSGTARFPAEGDPEVEPSAVAAEVVPQRAPAVHAARPVWVGPVGAVAVAAAVAAAGADDRRAQRD